MCLSIVFLLFAPFLFALVEYPYFVLTLTQSFLFFVWERHLHHLDFSGSLAFHDLPSILIFKFLLAPSMRCDSSQGFKKEKLIQTQIGTTRGIFLEHDGITNMAFHHFKRKQLESINFILVLCNGLGLCFYESLTSKSNYTRLYIKLKYGIRHMRCEFFFSCHCSKLFGHLKIKIT